VVEEEDANTSLYTENSEILDSSGLQTTDEGVRKSSRNKVRPMQFWKNEKVTYAIDKKTHLRTFESAPEITATPRKQRRINNNKDYPESSMEITITDESGDKSTKVIGVSKKEYRKQFEMGKKAKSFSILDGDKFESGFYIIPGGSKEKTKVAKNTEIFFVISGLICAVINGQHQTFHKGAQFYIPPGNTFSFDNPTKTTCELHVTTLE